MAGLLAVAIDGTVMTVADSEANLAVCAKHRGGANGGSGYPMLRLLVLVSCGTRTVIDAVFGPVSAGETTCAPGLLASLHAGMILLALCRDRDYAGATRTAPAAQQVLGQRPGSPADPLFPTITGRRLSSDAVQDLVQRHAAAAKARCPSLRDKHVTPHALRHSAAMALLEAGVDPVTIALWLGHESPRSTQPYVHADLKLKEKALARTASPDVTAGRYRPPDRLLAFLEGLGLSRPHAAQGPLTSASAVIPGIIAVPA